MIRPTAIATAALLLTAMATTATAGPSWSSWRDPAPGQPEAIGSAAAGCLRGAEALAWTGDGYQVLRPERNRRWGHPLTIAFIRDLAGGLRADSGKILLIGDIAQPRGGPMPSGHASHQSGLDVDIWFRMPSQPLSADEIAAPRPRTMVRDGVVDPAAWGADQARLVERAARHPAVERLFVNPAIKRALCDGADPADRDWLRAVRPWRGHDEHVHVRLACPQESPHCEKQAPIPPGDGCGAELDSWLVPPPPLAIPAPPSSPAPPRRLPAACTAIAAAP